MDAARTGSETRDGRFEGLQAEASSAVGYSANTLRGVRDRYRDAVSDLETDWQALRDELGATDRSPRDARAPDSKGASEDERAAVAAEAGAEDARVRALRNRVEHLGSELGAHQASLARLELAEGTLSRTWLFMERGDSTLVSNSGGQLTEADLAMRIVEAQEAERARLALEIHDGPAQALTNAIFQAEYMERVGQTDPGAAVAELPVLREMLRRDLGDVRDVISQLRPAVMDQGLDAALQETAERLRRLTDVTVTTDLQGSDEGLDERQRTVVLRIAQEALHNVRKHAGASAVSVSTSRTDDDWSLEIRDDGRGFDVGAVAARGRQNFGLQFMRERAELIGARFDVRSRPDGGTVVRLVIPTSARFGAEESR